MPVLSWGTRLDGMREERGVVSHYNDFFPSLSSALSTFCMDRYTALYPVLCSSLLDGGSVRQSPIRVRKANAAHDFTHYTSAMHHRISCSKEGSEIGWGNNTTPLRERSLADQAAHQYCTRRRKEAFSFLAAWDIRRYVIIVLQEREEYDREVEKRTYAQGGPVHPAPDLRLVQSGQREH